MKKVSVIIPVYNQEELVIKAIKSIPKRDDIEIIVIDDCSTDNTWKNLFKYYKYQDNKIKLLKNDINKGVGYTVNKGYDNATGEYVLLLGSDDYLITDKVNEIIDNYLNGEDMIYFNLEINDGTVWHLNNKSKDTFVGSTKFTKREFLGNSRCPELRCNEDWFLYKELQNKKPTEVFTDITMKHYNFPRKGSLINTGGENGK